MDAVDRQLIQALRENGRASYAELGRLVGLSGPSVTDRINRLEAAGVEVVEIRSLPYATVAATTVPVPYVNFYICNGAVLVPTVGGGESRWLDAIGEAVGDREVVAVPGEVLAYGGGGVHCITQQVIAR